MRAILPATFDLQNHLADYPPGHYGLPVFNNDYALYILSQITLVPARNKEIADTMNDGYTPLNAQKLQATVRHYDQYLKYFLDTGILETDGKYYKGEGGVSGKSRGYRFAETLIEQPIETVDYSAGFVQVLKKKRRANYAELKPDYGHLTKWLWPDCKLQIDAETGKKFLEIRRQAQLLDPRLLEPKKPNGFSFESLGKTQTKDPAEQYRHAIAGINCIITGDIGCTVDSKVYRMHTVLTNLKSDLRNLITYAGQPLVSIDITNSQPYLATLLTDHKFYKISKAARTLPNPFTLKSLTNPPINVISPLMLVNIQQLLDKEDIRLYRNLVSKGSSLKVDLYSYLLDECTKRGISLGVGDRGAVKEGVFEMLFSKNGNSSKVKKLFKELFPSVAELFRIMKEDNHARLPILLQRIESTAMLKVITKQISKKHPNIPLFTIHDSITTLVEHADVVDQIMVNELTKLTGLPPKLKWDYWLPKNVEWRKYATAEQL